jgi:Mn2+/Fe2+ NRAMP family transporter
MRKRSTPTAAQHSHNPIVRYFRVLGPGLVTGAADDDPSGITAYSVAGASLGHSMLWMAWVTYPLMAAIQLVCARIGMVSGQGLAGAIRNGFWLNVLGWTATAVMTAAAAMYFVSLLE